ncbi:hypothetical protein OS493_017226 [Desmophyllum pertusum]|uniref:Uncharacterized protein n=1 Tax=Desmophyllum pertusum TaxID=174260 RepID=A0A9X0A188_9CNID|nr:hypothetical protein OS493_017226 [Desmophyllum pertusum]
MGRRLRTSIPVTGDMLKPQLHDPEEVLPKLKERQRKQKKQHDRSAKELPPLRDGEILQGRNGAWRVSKKSEQSVKDGVSQAEEIITDDDLPETAAESTSVADNASR